MPRSFQPGSGIVVLTHGFWERRFGGDAGILGRSLTLGGQPYTVVGILAPDFELGLERGRDQRDLYVPKVNAEYETFIRSSGWWQRHRASPAGGHPRGGAGGDGHNSR